MKTINDLYGMDDESFHDFLIDQGYISPKKLSDDNEWVAICPLAYSTSVCCGMDVVTAFKYRWCFAKKEDAQTFFDNLKCFDDIPANLDQLVGHRYSNGIPLAMATDERGHNKW